jgi:hypothetical protein
LLLPTLSAVLTASIWIIPVALSYLRFGGFLDVSPALGVEWPLPTAFGSWGLLLPLAAFGGVLAVTQRRMETPVRVVLAFTAATVVLLLLTVARGRFGWTLGGNATLLHQGRVWPAAHLLGAAFAGVALVVVFDRVRSRSRSVAVAGIALVFAVGAVSPVFATIHLARVMKEQRRGFIYGRGDFDRGSFVRRAASELSARDVVRVEESDLLGFLLFQFSGARLASYDDPRMDGNDLRIRFADLAAGWEARMNGGGFAADYTAVPETVAPVRALVVVRGTFRGEPWVLVKGDLERLGPSYAR